MKKLLSRLGVAGVLLGLCGAIAAGLKPPPVAVEVAPAEVGPLEQTVVDQGRARVRERYTVSAPVAGTLARLELHEGDPVAPGTVLARLLPLPSPLLDPRARDVQVQRLASAQDGARQAEVTLERARQAVETSRRELERVQALAAQQAAPRAQLEAAQAELQVRESEAASARFAARVAAHGIEEARAGLMTFSPRAGASEQLEVTSPVKGQVLHVFHRSEGVVAAGTALLEVGDPDALELVVDVLSQDAVKLKAGMPARAVHWGGGVALAARVRRIEPAAFSRVSALGVEEQRVNVLLDLEGPPEAWRALGDGFATEVEIATWSRPEALQVPASALFQGPSGWAVFVAEAGRARARSVEVGHRGPLKAEVLAGLAAREAVVLHPGATVKDGVAVEVRR